MSSDATCATGAAQRRVVRTTPSRGRMERNFFTVLVKAVLSVTPSNVGTNTTCAPNLKSGVCKD